MQTSKKLWHFQVLIYLSITLITCKEKKAAPPEVDQSVTITTDDSFVQIFDGKTLDGWYGDSTYWRVENGNLIGEVTPTTLLKKNTFIIWEGGEPSDFELKLEFRIAEAGNSGINYRSELLDSIPFALRGYQADIDGKIRYTGQNYEERKRTTLAYRGENVIVSSQDNPSDSLKLKVKFEDWNEVHLIAKGNHLRHYVNGILMSEVLDNDSINRKLSGKLGVQVHVGPPMKVEYRNIRLKNR